MVDSAKERWVVFTEHNAVVVKNPSGAKLKQLMMNPVAFKNPDMTCVYGVPPHYWKPPIDGSNMIQPMSIEEMQQRSREIATEKINNNWELPWAPRKFQWFQLRVIAYSAATATAVCVLFKLAAIFSPF